MAQGKDTTNFQSMLFRFMGMEDPMLNMLEWLCAQMMEVEAKKLVTYCISKIFRMLVAIKSYTQMLSPSAYEFVPIQDFSKSWTDKELYLKYKLSNAEIEFIESNIKTYNI
ncbi:MAG: hypothetical protein PHP02_01595 [Eubacteriales bacterium]|nr:hypothetical protein [Eubacteriales bacterium]